MLRLVLVACVFVGRVFVACMFAAAGYADQTVDGRVINSATGAGIPDVHVSLLGSGDILYEADTNELGRFRIDNVKEGSYLPMYNALNYFRDSRVRNPSLQVTKGGEPVHLELTLAPAGRVTGKVMDGEGKPVPKAFIQLQGENGAGIMMMFANEKGEYQTPAVLGPGPWKLAAAAPVTWKAPKPVDGQQLGWARTFYPHATDPLLAGLIVVPAGGEISLDVKLIAVPAHRVRVAVVDERGEPLPHVPIRISQAGNAAFPAMVASDVDAAEGKVEFEPLPAGEWTFSAALERNGVKLWGSQTVPVKDQDLEEVKLKLTPPFSVQGKIVLEAVEGKPVPKAPGVRLVMEKVFRSSSRFEVVQGLGLEGNGFFAGVLDETGNFTIDNLYPGWYHIIPELAPPGYYLDSIKLGAADAVDFGVSMQPTDPPLTITYKLNGGTVHGTVENCAGGKVMLIPVNPLLRRDGFIRQANCSEKGLFEIPSVRPGDYYGFAVPPDHPAGAPGAPLDQSLINQSIRVSVGANESVSPEVHVIH